jgi:putative tricarboxylic transport membrane protein
MRMSQDLGAGLFLLGIAAVALWQSADLPAGSLGQVGPGMLPRGLAVATGLIGAVLVFRSLTSKGVALERWEVRGPLCILGAVVAFGLAVRPLGLVVAGPLAIILGAFASPQPRWLETLLFSVGMTAFCLLLFKVLLTLPIPVIPWAIGY